MTLEARHVDALQGELDRLRLEVEELRASRRRLVLAADTERRGLERALHDGLQQRLVALAVDLQLAASDSAAVEALLQDVHQTLAEAGQLAQRIYPPLLEAGGLAAALRAAAVSTGIRIALDVQAGTSYPPGVAGTVYWCCLEALQHARTQATVTVREEEETLVFEVTTGAAGSEAELVVLRDRVEALGGRLATRSEPGGLLRLSGSLPLS